MHRWHKYLRSANEMLQDIWFKTKKQPWKVLLRFIDLAVMIHSSNTATTCQQRRRKKDLFRVKLQIAEAFVASKAVNKKILSKDEESDEDLQLIL